MHSIVMARASMGRENMETTSLARSQRELASKLAQPTASSKRRGNESLKLIQFAGLFGFLLLILAWYLVSAVQFVGTGLPRPDQVVVELIDRWPSALKGLWASTRRVLIGLLIGVSLAIPLGFLLAANRWASAMFAPIVNFARSLPPIALIPLVVIYLGIGEQARIMVLTYSAFFPALVVIFESVASLDPIYVRAGQTLGATRFEIFTRIVLPATMPAIFVALRVSLGVTWATVVAAELIAAQTGLGAFIQDAANFFQTAAMIGGIILIGAVAVLMDRIVQWLQFYFLDWQEKSFR